MLAKNEKVLKKELRKLKKNGISNIINGKELNASSRKTFQSLSPADGKLIVEVAEGLSLIHI